MLIVIKPSLRRRTAAEFASHGPLTSRGFGSPASRLVILDEASRVDDALLGALRPTMATVDGSLIALTTPAGKRGWFFEAWTSSDPTWHRVMVPASQCPRLSQAFLDEERRQLGLSLYLQEYELTFLDDAECLGGLEIDDAFPASILAPSCRCKLIWNVRYWH